MNTKLQTHISFVLTSYLLIVLCLSWSIRVETKKHLFNRQGYSSWCWTSALYPGGNLFLRLPRFSHPTAGRHPALVSGHLCWWQAGSPKLFPCGCWVSEIGTWSETGTSLPKGWRCNSSKFWNISWTSKQGSADASAKGTHGFLQAWSSIRGTTTATRMPAVSSSASITWQESIRFGQSHTQAGFGSSSNSIGILSEQSLNWLQLVM